MKRLKGMKVLLGFLFGLGFWHSPLLYGEPPIGYTEYLDVTAKIDGSDWFEMTGNQWRWQHRNWDVPEYHGGTDSTIVNGQSFLSSWPNGTGYLSYSAYNIIFILKCHK